MRRVQLGRRAQVSLAETYRSAYVTGAVMIGWLLEVRGLDLDEHCDRWDMLYGGMKMLVW